MISIDIDRIIRNLSSIAGTNVVDDLTKGVDVHNVNKLWQVFAFMDFYIRKANNNVSEEEIVLYSRQLLEGLKKFIKDDDFMGENRDPGWGDHPHPDLVVLRDIESVLENGNSMDKSIAIERLVHISHDFEPTIIPHIYGIGQEERVRSRIGEVLKDIWEYLASSDRTTLEHNDERRFVYERNSEHRRKIIKSKKKEKQKAAVKSSLVRKNIAG